MSAVRVHQILPRFEMGDAISYHSLYIRDTLDEANYTNSIYASSVEENSKHICSELEHFDEFIDNRDDVLIFHFSVYDESYKKLLESKNKKILVYHNVTPPEMIEKYNKEVAEICRKGKALLPELKLVDLAVADSEFNRQDLLNCGFEEHRTRVLPIKPMLNRFDAFKDDKAMAKRLCDGRLNMLYVGRVYPNKGIFDLVRIFACLNRYVNARTRMLVAGSCLKDYLADVISLVREYGIEKEFFILDKVTDQELGTLFRYSHMYISMSDHEGFCVPIVEAMSFDLPVLAYDAGAVADTMGGAGVLVKEKNPEDIAVLADMILTESGIRDQILARQKKRIDFFTGKSIDEELKSFVKNVSEKN